MSTGKVEKVRTLATGCKYGVFVVLSGAFLAGALEVGNRLELEFGPSLTRFAAAGDLEMVEHVLDLGADASAADSRGFIPLEAAMFSRNNVRDIIVKKLLENGADPRAKGHHGLTPIQLAAMSRLDTTVGYLRDAGGEFTIIEAVFLDDAEAAEDLLKEYPESVNIRTDARPHLHSMLGNETELTPLHIAAARGERDIVEILLDHGAEMNARNRNGHTPLHYSLLFALLGNTSEVTVFLLERGADVNARDAMGRTALHIYAAQYFFGTNAGSADIIDAFVEHGADVYAIDNEGRSPMEVASSTVIFRRNDLLTAAFERHTAL